MKEKITNLVICCLLFGLLFSSNVFAEVLAVEQEKVNNNTFITTVIVPITAALLGSIVTGFIGWLIGRRQFKKELVIAILPEKNSFIVYNTGNTNVNAKEICLYQKHWLEKKPIYSKLITDNVNISNNVNPVFFDYDKDDFFSAYNDWAHGTANMKLGDNLYCMLIDIKGKRYKSKSKYLPANFKEYNHNYWYPAGSENKYDSSTPF